MLVSDVDDDMLHDIRPPPHQVVVKVSCGKRGSDHAMPGTVPTGEIHPPLMQSSRNYGSVENRYRPCLTFMLPHNQMEGFKFAT